MHYHLRDYLDNIPECVHRKFLCLLAGFLIKKVTHANFEIRASRMLSITREDAKQLRLRIMGDFYLIHTVKARLFLVGAPKSVTRPRAHRSDKEAILYMQDLISRRGLAEALWESAEYTHKMLRNNTSIARKFAKWKKELTAYANKLVHSKLAFIVSSENMENADMRNELLTEAYQALLWMLPTDRTETHARNALKTGMSNTVQNIIRQYTSAKRQRLVNNGDGSFSLVVATSSQLGGDYAHFESPQAQATAPAISLQNSVKEAEYSTLERQATSCISKMNKGEKILRLVNLLRGEFDSSFTDWLKAHKRVKLEQHEGNDYLCDRINFNTYRDYVLEYMKLPFDKFLSVMKRVASSLSMDFNAKAFA